MMKENRLGIYIHIPFCMSKCPYCDFYSIVLKDNKLKDEFLKSLIIEIKDFENKEKYVVDTIYFGGGTPSILNYNDFSLILDEIRNSFTLSNDVEITAEFNPKHFSNLENELIALKDLGLNRISLGVQSFNEKTLRKLGRIHKNSDTFSTINSLKKAGFNNFSIDIMFGIPDETLEEFKADIDEAINLNPVHISLYSLEFMEGTRFTRLLNEGKMKETDPSLDREMYHYAISKLEENGYKQYEISNFSKEGFESKHNLKYWNLDEYIGFGPSAHSFIGNKRFNNVANLDEYINKPLVKEIYEEASFSDLVSEYTFTSLRKNEGIKLKEFKDRFNISFFEYFKDIKVELLKYKEYVYIDDEVIKLNINGFDISNEILCLFV